MANDHVRQRCAYAFVPPELIMRKCEQVNTAVPEFALNRVCGEFNERGLAFSHIERVTFAWEPPIGMLAAPGWLPSEHREVHRDLVAEQRSVLLNAAIQKCDRSGSGAERNEAATCREAPPARNRPRMIGDPLKRHIRVPQVWHRVVQPHRVGV